MYTISKLTGKIYLGEVEILRDDRLENWSLYIEWLINGGMPIEFEGTQEEEQTAYLEDSLNAEKNRYLQRTKDGQEAYAKISAEFRLAKLAGIITEENQKAIEKILIPVRNEVLSGQWISAVQILEEIGNSNIGVDLYDRLHLQISNYINNSY